MKICTKKKHIFLVFSGITLICLIQFGTFVDNVKRFVEIRKTTDNTTKYVLYWTKFWQQNAFGLGFGFKPFETCEYKNCFATNDRAAVPLEEFDAFIFHASIYSKKKHGVPKIRRPHQMYIFMNIEAPVNLSPNLVQYSSFFNWTMSYRFDSDIVRRHATVIKRKLNYTMPSSDTLKNKTSIAAWLVSHCRTASKRERLGKEIQKYIPVDVYGRCGPLRCPRKRGTVLSSKQCYEIIEKKYKFYFSFENSYCRDYATEKLYKYLPWNVVPVVYGAGNYSLGTPPNSVINVEDFQSAKDLADYLKYLDENEEEYLKYFEWKKEYEIAESQRPTACQICKKLNEPIKESIYHDLYSWWWGKNNNPICRTGKALPKIVNNAS